MKTCENRTSHTPRTGFAALAAATVLLTPLALGQLQIDSLGANGLLSWSDPGGTGTHYAVQWSSSGL
ncbi:MAG TPA: hypothetical protein PKK20_12165, partial [Verrucomicrobiota bacterium]|nr:hypothetical protein [Verrucomicrobiota bacterium]